MAAMPPKATILLVEDHEDTREAVAELLGCEGYAVRTAENGATALASLDRYPDCDIFILDWRLPDMNGGKVLCALRASPHLAGVPVIVVSADGLTADDVQAAGGSAFLHKPVAPDVLLALVGRLARGQAGDPMPSYCASSQNSH